MQVCLTGTQGHLRNDLIANSVPATGSNSAADLLCDSGLLVSLPWTRMFYMKSEELNKIISMTNARSEDCCFASDPGCGRLAAWEEGLR